jgi:hypothetical protein
VSTKPGSDVRRAIGFAICVSPVLLLAASFACAVSHGDQHRLVGAIVLLLASLIAALNFYLSFVRGWLHVRAKGSTDDYQHVSGFPFVGTALVIVGTALGFGSLLCVGLGLLCMGFDTGGSIWFLIATWKHPW